MIFGSQNFEFLCLFHKLLVTIIFLGNLMRSHQIVSKHLNWIYVKIWLGPIYKGLIVELFIKSNRLFLTVNI